jgi:hypothetical protein
MATDSNGTNLLFRVEALERDVKERVNNTEYHLQISVIKETLNDIKEAVNKLAIQFTLMQERLTDQELKAEQRAAAQQQALSDMKTEQAKTLANFQAKFIGWFLTIAGLVIAGYLTWYFTRPH